MNNTPVLPTFYYQHNFLHLLQRVNNLYRDLLNDAEIQFVDDFLTLSQDAQCLYIRLLCRKGDVFRLDKLNYPEIHSPDLACQELLSAQFFCSVGLTDISDFGENNLIKLFSKKELLDRYCGIAPEAQRGALNALSREQLVQRLLTQAESESWWQSLLSVGVIGVFGELEFTTLRLLYFGNLHQDFSDFVLRDLGIYRYEKYPLELAQARQTELPPETKQRISLPFLIATIALLVIAGVGIYTVYTFLTPDRKFEKATVENKKKQRMDNSESNQSPSGPPKPNNSETAGKQKAPKPAIRLALAFGPVSPLGCIFELELSKPASLPLLRLHADMEFIGMGETVITSKTLKLDLNSDPMRSKYSGQLALLEIPCNVVSQAIIADVTACQVRDKPTSFCRKLVKDDPRSKFPIRRF